jgi:hypothetical protein
MKLATKILLEVMSKTVIIILGSFLVVLLGVFFFVFSGNLAIPDIIKEATKTTKVNNSQVTTVEKIGESIYLTGKISTAFKLNGDGLPESQFNVEADPGQNSVRLVVFGSKGGIFVGDPKRPVDSPKYLFTPYIAIESAVTAGKNIKIKLSTKPSNSLMTDRYAGFLAKIEKGDWSVMKETDMVLFTDMIELLD